MPKLISAILGVSVVEPYDKLDAFAFSLSPYSHNIHIFISSITNSTINTSSLIASSAKTDGRRELDRSKAMNETYIL